MIIEPYKNKFSLLPYFHIVKYTNSLSEQAKKDFKSEWNYYIHFEFGWLFWHNN